MSEIGLYWANNEKKREVILDYNPGQLENIQLIVEAIKMQNPGISDTEARIREVVSRFRGDAGLSAHRVNYLTAAIMKVIKDSCPAL